MSHGHLRRIHIDEERPLLGALGRRVMLVSFVAGALLLVVGILWGLTMGENAQQAFWSSYLTGFIYVLTLTLGALIFVIIQHVTRASWSVVVRRIAELYSNNFILLAVLAAPIVFIGAPHLYAWINPAATIHDAHAVHLVEHKSPYLNLPFFYVRIAAYFLIWIWLSRYFFTRSLSQDKDGNPETTIRMWVTSGPSVLIFALTSTFAAFDFVMSLTPIWYSTMFGVYFFAGSMLGFMALLGATCLFLQGRGHLVNIITNEHYHDIGKLAFAFTFFWGYIAFSQFMLIWYGNIQEETQWFLDRQRGSWLWLEVGLLFGHFFIPFLGLIGRWAKRRRGVLAFWCIWVLIWHFLDIVYLILPTFNPTGVPMLVPTILITLGMLGLCWGFAALSAAGRPILPVRDPRLIESLEFDNIKV